MAKVSVTEAAKLAGIGRQQLYRGYIYPGKITVERDHRGRPIIDTAEIMRVFGVLHDTPEDTQNEQQDTSNFRNRYIELEARFQEMEKLVLALQAQLAEAKEREEWLRSRIEAAEQKLLAGPESKRRRWWPW